MDLKLEWNASQRWSVPVGDMEHTNIPFLEQKFSSKSLFREKKCISANSAARVPLGQVFLLATTP